MSNHNLNVNPSDLHTIVCDNCKGEIFTPWVTIKFLPGLLSPDGTPGAMHVQLGHICTGCGKTFGIRDAVRVGMAQDEERKQTKIHIIGTEHES